MLNSTGIIFIFLWFCDSVIPLLSEPNWHLQCVKLRAWQDHLVSAGIWVPHTYFGWRTDQKLQIMILLKSDIPLLFSLFMTKCNHLYSVIIYIYLFNLFIYLVLLLYVVNVSEVSVQRILLKGFGRCLKLNIVAEDALLRSNR